MVILLVRRPVLLAFTLEVVRLAFRRDLGEVRLLDRNDGVLIFNDFGVSDGLVGCSRELADLLLLLDVLGGGLAFSREVHFLLNLDRQSPLSLKLLLQCFQLGEKDLLFDEEVLFLCLESLFLLQTLLLGREQLLSLLECVLEHLV